VLLAVQYLLTASLMAPVVIWQVAAVKAVVGLLVVAILSLSGRQVMLSRRAAEQAPEAAPPAGRLAALRGMHLQTNLPFRSVAVLLMAVATWYAVTAGGFALAELPLSLNLAGYLLIALGLLSLGLTEEPMSAGIGLLMVLNGFEVLYAPIERSLTVAALLAAVNFGVALAVSHLTLLRYTGEGPAA
ncbi:MAG: hypothetical protein JNK29_00935, partial [Anaerolineales bacterium]|nr:hypothetical protein [Anaerolineales bacterium]